MHIILKWLLPFIIAITMLGCVEQEPEPTYYHMVYRLNYDGSTTEWEVHSGLITNGPFVCWPSKTGGEFCISGVITIVPIKVECATVVEEQKSKQESKE